MVAELPSRVPDLFGMGNDKIGNALTFSIPAIDTCPGASGLCKGLCYATRGHYHGSNVKDRLHRNWEHSKHPDFAETAIRLLNGMNRKSAKIFRVHPSGDLYDVTYARKWFQIMKRCPSWTFWIYTRSWRIKEFLPVLTNIAKLPNVQLWFSVDNETGRPLEVPPGVRLAYMMIDDNDEPRWDTDLFFRDGGIRDSVRKHIRGTLVCPVENGVSHTTCDKCRVCLTDPVQDPSKRTHDRFALPIVN